MREEHLNVLAFYLGAREAYRELLFSPTEVFCSPDCSPTGDADGPRTIRTPPGQYDIGTVLRDLPRALWPDILVVKADGTLRNLPCNLNALDCRKVLVIGDTHHLQSPITALLNYALTERFDILLSDTNRQHIHFFRSAGFANTYWLPHLTWTPNWHDVSPQTSEDVVFVGQVGHLHPRRRSVLREAARRGLPVRVHALSQREAAERYARAAVALNCSLYGDINLRTFEVLAAGGLLLTDELSAPSGLSLLFENGRHLATYSSIDDLVEKARYYLDHQDAALAVRRAGRAHVKANHAPELQRRRFLDLVLDGKVDPVLEVEDPRCASAAVPIAHLLPRAAAYEGVQEVHRSAAKVRVFHDQPASKCVEDLRDLPRLTLHPSVELLQFGSEHPSFTAAPQDASIEHVLILSAAIQAADLQRVLGIFLGRHILIDGAFTMLSIAGLSELTSSLRGWGFSLVDPVAFAFLRTNPIASLDNMKRSSAASIVLDAARAIVHESNDADACHAAGLTSAELGDGALSRRCFEKAARLDRGHGAALEALSGSAREVSRPGNDARPCAEPTRGPRRRYLVVTNLFPPEELGGYGRKMHAFTASLAARGHEIRVLAGSAPYLERAATTDPPLPVRIDRDLQLTGKWEEGAMKVLQDPAAVKAVAKHNRNAVMRAAAEFTPDVCLLGNLDFLQTDLLQSLVAEDVQVLHSIGSATPGYPVTEAPRGRNYHPLPASEWVARQLREAGYSFHSTTVVYPGAQLAHFECGRPPWPHGLRIAFAGLMLPFKGPQVLLQALTILRREGVDFRCEMAGDTTSAQFVGSVQGFISKSGLSERVQLLGLLDRAGLAALFARSNVFVFPSLVPEAFGISQVEAMAAGLTIVSTATGGAREVVDSDTALLVDPNNPTQLAERLRALNDDPLLCERLGRNARTRASKFSVEAGVDRIEALTNQLVAEAS